MTDRTCSCGMNRYPAEGEPSPFTHEWHVAHRVRHVAAFPDLDRVSRLNLDSFVESSAPDGQEVFAL